MTTPAGRRVAVERLADRVARIVEARREDAR